MNNYSNLCKYLKQELVIFLEKLETLSELVLPDTITNIVLNEKIEKILHDNNTLIRGNIDSFAQKFCV